VKSNPQENSRGSASLLRDDHLAPAIAVLERAFQDYPLMEFAVPEPGQRAAAVRSLYGGILRYCYRFAEAYTTPAIEGAAGWLPPGQRLPGFFRMVRSGMLGVPWHFGWSGFGRLHALDSVAQRLRQAIAPMPHWYLWAIGVDPGHQGKGVGARLLAPILTRADEAGLPCYLETHKEKNLHFYQSHGFRVESFADGPGTPIRAWGMLRPPRAVNKQQVSSASINPGDAR
jgi:GNAT superfamily N-acetyltransferase